jgi:hypothetical protein
MATLSESDRIQAMAEVMRDLVGESISITKPDLIAAVNAVDTWVSNNEYSYDTNLPAIAKAGLTVSQKAKLLLYVVRKRFVIGV